LARDRLYRAPHNLGKGEDMPRKFLIAALALLGLFLVAGCGPAKATGQANPDGSVDVNVNLTDFAIESSVTEFEPGVLYHFTVTNSGQIPHEFMILPVSEHMGMAGMSMEEFDELALMMIPIEQLPVGATAEADYTFASVPNQAIELVCMTPGHFEAGMHLPITVK
jgi:uncharacterized cupredoxin-like copper-binding protein